MGISIKKALGGSIGGGNILESAKRVSINDVKGAFDTVGRTITGDSKNAGILGLGQHKASEHNIDWDAFNKDDVGLARRENIAGQGTQVLARKAPVMDTSKDNQFRTTQLSLAGDLAARARGEGPSIAEQSLRRTTDRNVASAFALMNSGRGGAAAARGVTNQVANLNQQAAADTATLRLQEAENARNALGNVLHQGRTSDIDIAGRDQDAVLRSRHINDLAMGKINDQLLQSEKDAADRRIAGQRLAVDQKVGVAGANAASYKDASERRGEFLGKLGEGIMSYMPMAAAHGLKVPGEAPYPGDDPRNDTVLVATSPGELILPRSISDDPDAAREFVAKVSGKKKGGTSQDKVSKALKTKLGKAA